MVSSSRNNKYFQDEFKAQKFLLCGLFNQAFLCTDIFILLLFINFSNST